MLCVDRCPCGWGCAGLSQGGDPVLLCVPEAIPLCVACTTDAACGPSLRCAPGSDGGPGRCLQPCAGAGAPCPRGHRCEEAGAAWLCAPAEGAGCCAAGVDGSEGVCHLENTAGRCPGVRVCGGASGWGPCLAQIPADEVCDGQDNDCDGETDEGLGLGCACGDGACNADGGETARTCPRDCASCGDRVCSPGESPAECPVDCCQAPDGGSGCGDGACLGYGCGESPDTCPADCGAACGDGTCDRGENPGACPADCKHQACGNRVCEPTDGGPLGCPVDCASACGDCVCDGTEDFQSCPIDCGSCGDAVCSGCVHLRELEACGADCDGVGASPELCNGRDDDGDGATDEGLCDDGNPCTAGACDGAASACRQTQRPDGAPCDDGDPQTTGDACDGGACRGAVAACAGAGDCDDGDPCTVDTCAPAATCERSPAQDGTPCDDGDPATDDDRCEAGRCVGSADDSCATAADCDDADPCTEDRCEGSPRDCAHKRVAEGSACDDGDASTELDRCFGGVCRGRATRCDADEACDDGNPCTDDTCDGSTGTCRARSFFRGFDCDDGDPATDGDRCVRGLCRGDAIGAECSLRLDPPSIDFGGVPRGGVAQRTVWLHNDGDATCLLSGVAPVRAVACAPMAGGAVTCPSPAFEAVDDSPVFFFDEPGRIGDDILPGERRAVAVTFMPPQGGGTDDHAARLTVKARRAGADTSEARWFPAEVGQTRTVGPTLRGAGVSGSTVALPAVVDFGHVPVGCGGGQREVRLHGSTANGQAFERATLDGSCPGGFRIVSTPNAGDEGTVGAPQDLRVAWTPAAEGAARCHLRVHLSGGGPPLVVALRGTGVAASSHRSTWYVPDRRLADLLFVVDDSGSMSEEQQQLAAAMADFAAAVPAGLDAGFHLALTSTDTDDGDATFQTLPRVYLPETGDAAERFGDAVVALGTDGSATERGLDAALRALTPPERGREFAADGDWIFCSDDRNCTPPFECFGPVDQTISDAFPRCMMRNEGFLRPSASLEIVVLSDEEDQSPQAVSYYVDALRALKGYDPGQPVRVHAIAGVDPERGIGATCDGAGGSADAGHRYAAAAAATGGLLSSICGADFGPALAAIAHRALGPSARFPLDPNRSTATAPSVSVDGEPCTDGVAVDGAGDAVLIDPTSACFPREAQAVVVTEELRCQAP